MYDNPNLQYSQLVMAARKAETETPGGSMLETRAKSAVVKLKVQPKVASLINHMKQSHNRLHT